jgi:hypothetical protein
MGTRQQQVDPLAPLADSCNRDRDGRYDVFLHQALDQNLPPEE